MELANGKLPPELLSQVASYLDDGDLFILAGYALVCRSWLLVFERLLYRDINVYSDSHESIRDLKAMTLQQFKTRTSGPNFYRRSFVKELHYNIITPCPIKEHWHRPGVGNDYERNLYYEQNLERAEENNVAFREGFEALWGVLSVWDDAHRIAVVLSAACLDEMEKEELGEESWRKSPALAQGFSSLAPSLRVLELCGLRDDCWGNLLNFPHTDIPPFLNEITTFATNLRCLSTNLRKLVLVEVILPLDFLVPLDSKDKPAPGETLHWPLLETLDIEVPEFLPTGEWVCEVDPHMFSDEETDAPGAGSARAHEVLQHRGDRVIAHTEHYHRLFISLEHAAQQMPRLKTIYAQVQGERFNTFDFIAGDNLKKTTLVWNSLSEYKPDERVAKAWGFQPDDVKYDDRGINDLV
ncbi:hypothetical protein BJY04DRAFT_220527 [Aspergillus karnatakaensis]|uniref:F-box protein n=1 Tax=Aspergillus karnatakaensis TaxID=1810916 RepID=UPI003CCE01DF